MGREEERAIEWECTRLITSFYGLLDEKRYQELAGLFAPDGVWVRLGKELVGGDAIEAAMAEREDWLTVHLVSNIRVDIIDADNAETTQYITLYRQEGRGGNDGPAPLVPHLAILRHHDMLVRLGSSWKFVRKTSRAIMTDRGRITHYDKEKPQEADQS